jgi:hypothetical protein
MDILFLIAMANNGNYKNILSALIIGLGLSTILGMSGIALIPSAKTSIIDEAMASTGMIATTNKTLGNPIYEETTKSTGIRVIDVTHGPKVEVSFAGNGTINGTISVTDIGTIWTIPTNSSGNELYSEGQGILTTQQGEMATYTQQALGEITFEGSVIFHGSMFFNTLSPTGELAFLDNSVAVYNYESDLAGNAERKAWEWR